MAKLKAPLMSLGASGKLGGALVFFNWKGLNVVREYVVPTNPNTTDQQTQRGYLRAAVVKIHAAQADASHPLALIDQTAYAAWASVVQAATTWFNQAVRNAIKQLVASLTPAVFRGATIVETSGQVVITVYGSDIAGGGISEGNFHWGTSKTNLVNTKAAVIEGDDYKAVGTIDGLTNGTKYFFQFRPTVADRYLGSNSGIYHGTPAA